MAKMRKRTKISLATLCVMGLAVAVVATVIGLGAVSLLSQLIAFDVAILGAGIAIGAGIFAGSSSLTGYFSRKRALKKSAESVAEMAKVGQVDATKQSAIVKTKDNSLKAAKNFAKSSYKLSKFGISSINRSSQQVGTTEKQSKLQNKRYVYGLMNDLYVQRGKNSAAKKFDKKLRKIDDKLQNVDDVSAFAPKYHETAEFFNPLTSSWERDERSSVNFNNKETASFAKQLFDETTFNRYSDENKRLGATKVTIKSRGNSNVKDIDASTNAKELVDAMEFLALLDYDMTKKESGISGYPIMVETQEYKLDGSKKGKPSVMMIKNDAELESRLNQLRQNNTTQSTKQIEEKKHDPDLVYDL